LILNIVNGSLNDTKIVQTDPSTNFRNDDLRLVGDPADLNRICVNFAIPTGLDYQSIVKATVNLIVKTITGSNTNPTISSAYIAQNAVDYRYISWNNYSNGIAWTVAGGDIDSNTISQSSVLHSAVETTVAIDVTGSVIYAVTNGKANFNVLIYTTSANTNITYYSRETVGKLPQLEILYRDSSTADAAGRSSKIPSVPSA